MFSFWFRITAQEAGVWGETRHKETMQEAVIRMQVREGR